MSFVYLHWYTDALLGFIYGFVGLVYYIWDEGIGGCIFAENFKTKLIMKKFKTILMVLIAVLVSSTTMLKAQKPSSSSDLNSETSVNTGKSENYQLFTKTVKPGKLEIISEVKNASTEYWEFSNGVKVYLKPTQFKDDEIMLYAFRKGGYNIHKAEDLASAENSASLAYYSGVAKFDFSQMNEFLLQNLGKTM